MQALICQALSGYRSILLTHSYYSLHSNTRIGCLGVQWVSTKCMTFPVQRGSSWAMVVMLSMFVSLFEQCQANTMNKPQRSAGRGWRSMSPPWGKHLQQFPPVSVLWYWLFPCHTKKNVNLHILSSRLRTLHVRWKTIWTIGQNTVDKEWLTTVFLQIIGRWVEAALMYQFRLKVHRSVPSPCNHLYISDTPRTSCKILIH